MRFFNIDFHISVIADIQTLLCELGHSVVSRSLSNHAWVFGRDKDRVPGLDGMSTTAFGQKECDRFFELERHNLEEFDGFIVTHTPCLAGLYERTEKPIICVVSTRYDGFCQTPQSRAWLDETLCRMHDTGQLILLANNGYDVWHMERHIGIIPEIVPSYCAYTGARWTGATAPPFLHGRSEIAGLKRLRAKHTWEEVAAAACCVTVPYNASLMSIFERHTMGMPIVVPSREWTSENPQSLSDLRYSGTSTSEEIEAAIRLADWYCGELPGITFFDCEDHLRDLLARGIPPTSGMQDRKVQILETWKQVLANATNCRGHIHPVGHQPSPQALDLPGFWRWSEDHLGELCPNGVLIQRRDATGDLKFGTWKPAEAGFELDLTEHWHKSVRLSLAKSGVWYLNGSSEPNGSIHRVGISSFRRPADDERPYVNCDSFNRLAADSVFVMRTECVPEWHRRCHPCSPYSLVTNNSDRTVNGDFQTILDDDLLEVWYSTNAGIPHPKLRPIPIGVCHRYALKPDLIPSHYDRLLTAASRTEKTKQFNVSFTLASNPTARQRCLRATGLITTVLDRVSFIGDLGRSLYCISPDGNGMDCYRTWEALCCRSIPVITWNPMVEMGLYDGLPVIVLDQWEDFRKEDFTEERYEQLMRGFDPTCMTLDRWITPGVPAHSSTSGETGCPLLPEAINQSHCTVYSDPNPDEITINN